MPAISSRRYAMNIIIHRGTKQIGGSCVEVQSGSVRILLDLGLPLPTGDDDPPIQGQSVDDLLNSGILPRISGVYLGDDPEVQAVIMSHVHQDHIGLAPYVHPGIPIYATEGTWALHDSLQPFLPKTAEIGSRNILPKRKTVSFGSMAVTAIPVDHSAPDAAALLVEGEGERMLYTGDLRAHGRKAYLYDSLVRDFAGTIDLLLIEGTTIGRPDNEPATEQSLEPEFVRLFRGQTHMTLVFCSAQNLDRIVTIFRAAKQTGKIMVIDLYTAFTLHKLTCLSKSLPQWDWQGIRVVPWGYQQGRLEDAGQSVFVEETKRQWIGWKEMKARTSEIVLLMRSNRKMADLERQLGDETREVQVIWSMWDGYWADDKHTRPLCEKYGINRIYLHTSGHASWQDLKRLVEGLQPKTIVPIHTEHADHYAKHFGNVRLPADGEKLAIP